MFGEGSKLQIQLQLLSSMLQMDAVQPLLDSLWVSMPVELSIEYSMAVVHGLTPGGRAPAQTGQPPCPGAARI